MPDQIVVKRLLDLAAKFLPANVFLFLKSFSVSAFVGLLYIGVLELVQFLTQYQSALVHSGVAFTFYVLGTFLNYIMQRDLVFESTNKPVLGFFTYNLVNALLVSTLSAWVFSNVLLRGIFGSFIEGASIAIALLLISPITFLVFKYLFHRSR